MRNIPIYEQNSLNQIRSNCYIYMHGHSAGGTNPSLVEAMYLGLPIMSYGVQYNRETTEGKALYFDDKDGLVGLLENINDEELSVLARDMQETAKENYVWKKIARKYGLILNVE